MRQEKYRDPNPVVRLVVRRFFERIGAAVAAERPVSLLDAGCGEGELLRRGVLPAGLRMVCADLSPQALAGISGPARVCGSVGCLPFPARSFDVVLCLEVLEHLDDPAAAVRELSRVARKAVILSVPLEPWFRVGNVMRGKHLCGLGNHPEHIQHWNRSTFRVFLSPWVEDVQLIEAFPWIIARCRPVNGGPG